MKWSYLWIIVCPNFSEFLVHITVKQSAILGLSFFIAFENDGYEQFKEDETD